MSLATPTLAEEGTKKRPPDRPTSDEVGTPFCVTVDFQTLEDETVTVRDRDTMRQERVNAAALGDFVQERIA